MSDNKELIEMLEVQGYKHLRKIPGRGLCGIFRFMFTFGVLHGLDGFGYAGRWCYGSEVEALYALNTWLGEGDPKGNWLKYKGAGGERDNFKK